MASQHQASRRDKVLCTVCSLRSSAPEKCRKAARVTFNNKIRCHFSRQFEVVEIFLGGFHGVFNVMSGQDSALNGHSPRRSYEENRSTISHVGRLVPLWSHPDSPSQQPGSMKINVGLKKHGRYTIHYCKKWCMNDYIYYILFNLSMT